MLSSHETGWRIGGAGPWLWVAATEDATIYDVAWGRGFEAATRLGGTPRTVKTFWARHLMPVTSTPSNEARSLQGVGGNRTERGAEIQGRVMTFLRTAQLQGADAIAMMAELARAPTPGVVAGLTLRSG